MLPDTGRPVVPEEAWGRLPICAALRHGICLPRSCLALSGRFSQTTPAYQTVGAAAPLRSLFIGLSRSHPPPFSTGHLLHHVHCAVAPAICMWGSAAAIATVLLLVRALLHWVFPCQCTPSPMCLPHPLSMARGHCLFVWNGATHLQLLLPPLCPQCQHSLLLLPLP